MEVGDTLPLGLDCPICLGIFNTPKSLNCGHSFCAPCLKSICKSIQLQCPECRRLTPVFQGVDNLPTNYSLLKIVEQVKCSVDECNRVASGNHGTICPHCVICSTCLAQHKETLLGEINQRIGDVREFAVLLNQDTGRESVVALVEKNASETIQKIEEASMLYKTDRVRAKAIEDNKNRLIAQAKQFAEEAIAGTQISSNVNTALITQWLNIVDQIAKGHQIPSSDITFDQVSNLMSMMADVSETMSSAKKSAGNKTISLRFDASVSRGFKKALANRTGVSIVTASCPFDRSFDGSFDQEALFFECITCYGEDSAYRICEFCSKDHHDGHALIEDQDPDEFVCACGHAKHRQEVCTRLISERDFVHQNMYVCYTCFDIKRYQCDNHTPDTPGVCVVCVKKCHENHSVAFYDNCQFYCDCGSKQCGFRVSCQAK